MRRLAKYSLFADGLITSAVKFSVSAEDRDGWRTVARELHFEDAHLAVATERVCTPARDTPRSWTVVRRKPAVVIGALTAEGKLVLVRQERIPIRASIWEVPAGQIDGSSEPEPDEIAAVALRELREETGYQLCSGGDLTPLGDFFSSAGFTDEHSYFFLARPVEASSEGHAHDESESITDCRAFTAAELAAMIAKSEIRDSNTLGICAKLVARGYLDLHV